VTAGSPAEQAGLIGSGTDELGQPAPGSDIITEVDGIKVSSVDDMIAHLNNKQPGDTVLLSVLRGGQALTIQVTLGEWPG
jgi:S1-C subfamily serine protease